MTSTVSYTGQLHTEAVHLASGARIETDAPKDNHGLGACFSPTDLIATALASCILTTIAIQAEPKGLDVSGMHCEAEKVMAAGPRRISEIHIYISFPGGQHYTDEEQRLLIDIAEHCPVALSLHPDLRQHLAWTWNQS